jgi:pimeloyl-ACP methyl ester carboxylesterase
MPCQVSQMSHAIFTRADRPALAYRFQAGFGPTIIFLPGYMSDMAGGKATAVLADAAARGQACLLLDYSGCGLSEGRFADQTLIDWQRDAIDLITAKVDGPVLLVGSSMGGWLMLLVALALVDRDGPGRVAGLVGIAAAPDFTDWGFSDAQKAIIQAEGVLLEETPYSDQPYVTTRALWESGQANRLLGSGIALHCPVRLLHGQQDEDVPWDISLRLAAALASADVRVTLIKDGDHRLSRQADVALLLATIAGIGG